MRRALAAVLVAAGLVVPGVARAAEAPSEVRVVPAPLYTPLASYTPVFAGTTGVLHRRTSTSPYLWTTYAGQRTTVVEALTGVPVGAILPAGGDTVMLFASAPGHPVTDTTRQSLDLATMTWRELPSGPTAALNRLVGDSVLLVDSDPTPNTGELRRLAADGSYTTTPVTGIPNVSLTTTIMAADATAAVLRFNMPDGARYGLVDAASGRVALLPAGPAAGKVVLTDDRVGLITTTSVRSFLRSEIRAGTATEPQTVTLPSARPVQFVGLAGTDAIIAPLDDPSYPAVLRQTTVGGEPREVVARGDAVLVQGPDGVLVVGSDTSSEWSVRKVTGSGESAVVRINTPLVNAGVTLSSGALRHTAARVRPGEEAAYRNFGLSLVPAPTGTGSAVGSVDLITPMTCESGATCVRMVDAANSGSAYLSGGATPALRGTGPSTEAVPVAPTARLTDASPNYRLLRNDGSRDVVRNDGTKLATVGNPAAAALWFDTLYEASPTALVETYNLTTGTPGAQPVGTGSACPKTELQATGTHLYWTCGPEGPAGVVDLATRTNITVPAGQYLLGDNYLVRHDAGGDLLRYDLTGGTLGEAVTLATFPRGDLADDRNITWAVDKFGGDVAWVDADNAVHVVDPGVAPSRPVAGTVSASPEQLTLPGSFTVTAQLSRPVTASTLTIIPTRAALTTRVPGGAARVTSTTTWDGNLGGRAPKGSYRWTLAVTADGVSTTIANGTLTIGCGGSPTLHSYECTGLPTLFSLSSAADGTGVWQFTRRGPNDTTTLADPLHDGLRGLTGLVPFGDISKDYKNDLLVRRSDGSLRVFLGGENPPFGSNTSLLIPGNWNVYDALVHTGDVTGDDQSDLIARDRESGALFLFGGDGKGGFFPPTKIEGGYKGYSRFVGVGDINGDGPPDLMLQYDPTSTMYALYGNGNGTFQAGLKVVGTGWLGYNAVIGAGDLNEDGKNDLILRDTGGNLFRRLGTGQGTFGDRTQIGTGYQQYAGVY